MPTNLTETATFDTPVTVPSGADVIKASGVNTPFQSITNRTKFLKDRDDARYTAATRFVDMVPYPPLQSEWSIVGSAHPPVWLGTADSAQLILPFTPAFLPNGSTLSSVVVEVIPGTTRAGADRMSLRVFKYDGTTATQLGSTTYDDGTTNAQTITVSGLSEVVDRSTLVYYCVVTTGNNASSNNDNLYYCGITRTPSGTAVI